MSEGRNLNPIVHQEAPSGAAASAAAFAAVSSQLGAERLWWSPELLTLPASEQGAGRPESFDAQEIFDILRHINDPEHPLSLEQLKVCQLDKISLNDANSRVGVLFTPTIPHCSMATLIGLCLKVKLIRSLPRRFKIDVAITPGSHASETAINKQLADKERVAAALENEHLLSVVQKCIADTDPQQ